MMPLSSSGGTSWKGINTSNSQQTFQPWYSASGSYGYTIGQFYLIASGVGTEMQFGSSTTAAQRTDYKIGTALGTAPESGLFSTGLGSYAGGSVSFSGAISAGGSGTINEMGFFMALCNTSTAQQIIMMFHDILGSGVGYSAGNTLNGSYSISL